MAITDPIHFISGYVEICAENGFIERFINSCTAYGIPLWNMRKSGDKIYAKTTVKGFKSIRTPASQSSMRIHIMKKHGLPFYINRCLRRPSMVIGIGVMILILSFLTGRVWVIQVENTTDIPSNTILQTYYDAGLKVGMSKTTDLDLMRITAVKNLDEASWTNVNIVGSVATIKVLQSENPTKKKYSTAPSNIVASKDGQLEIIEPYQGTLVTFEGQTVTKGDLIVSGVTETKSQTNIFQKADAYVVASTTLPVSVTCSNEVNEITEVGKKIPLFYFLGFEFKLGIPSKENPTYNHMSYLSINGKQLPFGIGYYVCGKRSLQKTKLRSNETKLLAASDYALISYHETLHAQTISKKISQSKSENAITINGEYFCYENITAERPLEIAADFSSEEE